MPRRKVKPAAPVSKPKSSVLVLKLAEIKGGIKLGPIKKDKGKLKKGDIGIIISPHVQLFDVISGVDLVHYFIPNLRKIEKPRISKSQAKMLIKESYKDPGFTVIFRESEIIKPVTDLSNADELP